MENLLNQPTGAGMLFDADRTCPADKAIQVSHVGNDQRLWIIGDLHGDLLALVFAPWLSIRSLWGTRAMSSPAMEG